MNRLPSAQPWYTYTDSYFPGGSWDRAGIACLDNGDIYVFDITVWNKMAATLETFSLYGVLYKRRLDGTYLRLTPDGAWAHPYFVNGSGGGNGFDVEEGYLPEIALVIDTNYLASPMSHDGTDLYFQVQAQGKLLHLDTTTLELSLWIGVSAAASSPTSIDSGTGSTAKIGDHSAQFIRIGNHMYWMDNTISGSAYLNHIRRVSVDEPHGTNTITPSSWKSVPSWFTTPTDIARPDPATGLPYGFDANSHLNFFGNPTTHGLAYDSGYFYFFQTMNWDPGSEPSWWSGTLGGVCALRRWKWPDPDTNNEAPIETLFYAYGRGIVSDFESQPDGASTADYFFKDGIGGPLLEGFRVAATDLHVKDGYLYAHNWASETQTTGADRGGQALVRFNLADLETYVEENGKPLLHDRENPFFETINQASGWWVGAGDVTWNSRDRYQNYRDGGDPLNNIGYCTYDIGRGTYDGAILMVSTLSESMWMNSTTMHGVRVLREEGPPSTFDLTLSFDGLRMKGYQAQVEINDLAVPEVVTLT